MIPPDAGMSRYEVVRTVSQGRHATVLQALDLMHGQTVALKVYPVDGSDREAMFAEARVLMNLAPHPALPRLRGDFFTDDGDRYVIVMNWVDGVNLQQELDDNADEPVEIEEVLAEIAQAADALDHLHAQDPPIVHGDVKPGNLLRTASGKIVLVDFDIASGHGANRAGTSGFVAPEVMAGDKPGPAADVYGLAATAYALFSGMPPAQSRWHPPNGRRIELSGVMRVLRSALSADPTKRPASAGELVYRLQRAVEAEQSSGTIAVLALEPADVRSQRAEDMSEMYAWLARVRDVRDEVVSACGGRIISSTDREPAALVRFTDASAAARCALVLHDRVAAESFAPGVDLRLRAALAVGEATISDGQHLGAVIEHVVGMRSAAEPGTTITDEATAELLVGLVGSDLSIVAIPSPPPGLAHLGVAVFRLTRSGAEAEHADPKIVSDAPQANAPVPPERGTSRAAMMEAALDNPPTLAALTALGVALIYRFVLSAELGLRIVSDVAVAISAIIAVVSVMRHYARASSAAGRRMAEQRQAQELAERREQIDRERAEMRLRLEQGFARIDNADTREGTQISDALSLEYDAIASLLERSRSSASTMLSNTVPGLADETYRHGMSALSDALELFESAESPHRRRLQDELVDLTERLHRNEYHDPRDRPRDEQRRDAREKLLSRHEESRQRARDLMFEAERCTTALTEARIELASLRAGEAQVDVDAVVDTLQRTIGRVREVQDEFRRLGYS